MKIGQTENEFGTIVIQLQTRTEAQMFWALVRGDVKYDDENMKNWRREMSDWFSNHAKL